MLPEELRLWLAEIGDTPIASALTALVGGLTALQPAPAVDCTAFGARFRIDERVLCEVSLFGDLFIVRVGPQHAVEYRVRDVATALEALDHVVREHLRAYAAAPL